MGVEFKNDEEKEIYDETLAEFDEKEKILRASLNNIFITERNIAMELDMMLKILERADATYNNSSNVRKKKIVKLLFPNIYVTNKKGLTIEVNPSLKNILNLKSSRPGLEGIEPPTRSFGDSRSTTELKP